MSNPCIPVCPDPSIDTLHARFLSLLPRIERHSHVYFRHLKCPHKEENVIQEMIGLAWMWHLRLAETGQDASHFPAALASYATRAVRSGRRRLCGQERAGDVLSSLAAQRQHLAVGKLPNCEPLSDHSVSEAQHDITKLPSDGSVCFRLDFAAWLANLTEHDRGIAEALMIDGGDLFAPAASFVVGIA